MHDFGMVIKGFMATCPKIADSEMNYFQFKAKQMLLLKKEDQEWQAFCKEIAPDCAACLAEKEDLKEFKDVGIQVIPRRPINASERTSFQPRYQKEEIPEALNNIKTRLEKIDLSLSKMYDISHESKMELKPVIQERSYRPVTPVSHSEQTLKSLKEQRRLVIQNSLKASLQKLHASGFVNPKRPPTIKPKNSSYFLPHDLQVKRAASRKAYLASLQNKPKVSFQNERQKNNKNIQTSQNKKSVPKQTSKPRKKTGTKKLVKKSDKSKVETLIEDFVEYDTKDDNIEGVVDGILEDLLGEATIDLNKIKQKKREINFKKESKKTNEDKVKGTSTPLVSLTSSAITNAETKDIANDDNRSITKLKLFLESSEKTQQESDNLRKEQLIDKGTCMSHIEVSKPKNDGITTVKSPIDTSRFERECEIRKVSPKFTCGVSRTITVDPEKAKDISHNRDRFWRYLKSTSQTVKGKFNPWILNQMLAESILDDCINGIAEELSEMPSNFVQDLYNQEFVQQVES